MMWVAILLGPVAWMVALSVGAYRHFCILCEGKYHGSNTPLIWTKRGFRHGTWLLVSALSVVSAAAFHEMVGWIAPKLIAYLTFGVSLALRFVGSFGLAALYERRVGIRGYPSIAEQHREEEQTRRLVRLEMELQKSSSGAERRSLLEDFKREVNSSHPKLRWTTKEIDREIAFREGQTMDELEGVLERNEEAQQRDKEIAEIMFSSPEDKEISRNLKEIHASRKNDLPVKSA